jgi:hypothetical protein
MEVCRSCWAPATNVSLKSSLAAIAFLSCWMAEGPFRFGARGLLCGCPTNLADRKAAARAGRGPMPEVRIGFRLTDLPELGVFSFVSTSWELAAELSALAAALEVAVVPALGVLRCELVEFITRSGLAVSYRRPVVEVDRTQVLAQDAVRLAA